MIVFIKNDCEQPIPGSLQEKLIISVVDYIKQIYKHKKNYNTK